MAQAFHIRNILQMFFVALAYFLTARLGLSFEAVNGIATSVWPPAGIALAALLIGGKRYWIAIILGAFIANFSVGAPLLVAVGISIGNTLEALLGAYLLKRLIHFHNSLDRLRDVLGLFFIACIFSTLIAASVGTFSVWAGGLNPLLNYKAMWWTWWLGDMIGILIVAPFLLSWSQGYQPKLKFWDKVEAVGLLVLILLSSQLVFSQYILANNVPYPLSFGVFPFLIWASLRFGSRGASTGNLIVSGIGIWHTLKHQGPFQLENLHESLIFLQIFMGIISLTSLILAATASQRKQAEQALGQSEKKTLLFIDHALDAVVGMNSTGHITHWNPQAEKTFGWEKEEALGKSMSEIIIPERYRSSHEMSLKNFLSSKEESILNKRLELSALHRNGNEFPIELTVSPMKFDDQYIFSAFIRDITLSKKSEEILQLRTEELQRSNKELEQFAYIASHDLQEPLYIVAGFADTIKEQYGSNSDENMNFLLDRIQKAALRMRSLIGDLLQFARLSTQKHPFERIDLNEVIEEVLHDLEIRIQEAKAKVIVEKLPFLYADRLQMKQLFQNLISNSLKFRKRDQAPFIQIKVLAQDENFADISVQDNGIGFEQEYANHILEPFNRLHSHGEYEGSGLGLAICQKIMVRHQGKISAQGKLGEGAQFILRLSLKELS